MGELAQQPNIGKVLEAQLEEVGINTLKQLQKIGSKAAWLKIQEIDPSACIHRLYSLEGAIQGIKKAELADEMKVELKVFYQAHRIDQK